MGAWLGQHLKVGSEATVLPLTNGIWFWATAIAVVAWTLVWRHGEARTPPQRVPQESTP